MAKDNKISESGRRLSEELIPQTIIDAINHYNELVNELECECDPYNGFTCGIHNHRMLAKAAMELIYVPSNHSDLATKTNL